MPSAINESVASLMAAFRGGSHEAAAKLMDLFYPELKRMASGQMKGERSDHSWQPTLLVNELFLRIVKIKALRPSKTDYDDERAAFLALAGQIMKRLLIEHARPLSRKAKKLPVFEELLAKPDQSLMEVEGVLAQLGAIKPVIRTVVEMKVFEGQTAEQIAQELGCAPVTVHRHWQFAKQWMAAEWLR